MKVKGIVHYVMNFIFPRRCVICDELLPIHSKRYLERNYNQAELLAKEIQKNLKDIYVPVNTTLIKRIKKTEVLNKLSDEERKNVLKDVFFVDNSDNIRNVCIVDIKGMQMIQSHNRQYRKKVA